METHPFRPFTSCPRFFFHVGLHTGLQMEAGRFANMQESLTTCMLKVEVVLDLKKNVNTSFWGKKYDLKSHSNNFFIYVKGLPNVFFSSSNMIMSVWAKNKKTYCSFWRMTVVC